MTPDPQKAFFEERRRQDKGGLALGSEESPAPTARASRSEVSRLPAVALGARRAAEAAAALAGHGHRLGSSQVPR